MDLAESFGYSNGAEDVPLLESVGRPVAVAPEQPLRDEAEQRGWPVLDCVPCGGGPGVADLIRTAAFYGSFALAFGAGLGLGVLDCSRRQVFEITGGVGADLGLSMAGIDIDVVSGAEYLWSARPCVFVFNHQSLLDPVLVMKLLRGGFTGVAKKEAKRIPLFCLLFQTADVAFVDRGDLKQAKWAVAPAVAKIRGEGFSLALCRKVAVRRRRSWAGSRRARSTSPCRLGCRWCRSSSATRGEVMWRRNQTLRPGTVEIAVKPPFDTSEWRVDTLDDHVAEVRDVIDRTLATWPGETRLPGRCG